MPHKYNAARRHWISKPRCKATNWRGHEAVPVRMAGSEDPPLERIKWRQWHGDAGDP